MHTYILIVMLFMFANPPKFDWSELSLLLFDPLYSTWTVSRLANQETRCCMEQYTSNTWYTSWVRCKLVHVDNIYLKYVQWYVYFTVFHIKEIYFPCFFFHFLYIACNKFVYNTEGFQHLKLQCGYDSHTKWYILYKLLYKPLKLKKLFSTFNMFYRENQRNSFHLTDLILQISTPPEFRCLFNE